jgi:diacylglycerol kinase family enzyme
VAGSDNPPIPEYDGGVPGIGLITNPRSRANLRDPARPRRLGYLIGSHGTARATTSLDDLHRVCEELHKERIDVLGISGGDGTLHHTLTAMINAWGDDPKPAVAILRGGTMNTIANSLGIRGETSRLLFELVDKHRQGVQLETFDRNLLQINNRYGFIFGNGVIYNFLHEYYATGNPSPSEAAKLILGAAGSSVIGGPLSRRIYRRFRANVTVDGEHWACDDYITVAAAVVKEIGLGFKPFYRCDEQPGCFALLGIHTSAFGFVRELPNIHAGRPMRRDKVIDAVASHVRFEPLPPDEKLEYIIDGDTYVCDGPIELKTGPKVTFVKLTGEAQFEEPLPHGTLAGE